MPDQPTPDQRATDIANATGIRGPVIWAIARDAALAAILQSDQQQAELKALAEAMAEYLEQFGDAQRLTDAFREWQGGVQS